MNKILFILLFSCSIHAQNNFQAIIRDSETELPLFGVNVFIELLNIGSTSDSSGLVILNDIPDSTFTLTFSFLGYKHEEKEFSFPTESGITHLILLEPEAEEIEEVTVTTTRSSRLIEDEPTRVEAITEEELDEKISMDPSNISMLLNESTGIQVQQTSAASVNNTFRIQGLEGRYTQLLQDGFPLYSGFSGSLSINQIPPLNLSQVEIIKGSASTLYGGGAIAGLINLISKLPADDRELSILLNVTTAQGLDISGFSSEKNKHFGYTLFGSRNTQKAYDNNDDNFSDLPDIERFTINPNLFMYFDNITIQAGGSIITEDRTGGNISAIDDDKAGYYFETNESKRYSSLVRFDYQPDKSVHLSLKNTFGYFKRAIMLPGYKFEGKQVLSFSELTYANAFEDMQWIAGINFTTDNFNELTDSVFNRSYRDNVGGIFIQGIIDLSQTNILEAGFRTDYNKNYGWFPLPRISLLTKWNEHLSSRLGGGFGYKIPNIFTEQAEELNFRNLAPVNKNEVEAERSIGLNFDVNFKTIILDALTMSVNQLFFYTRIEKPVSLMTGETTISPYFFRNLPGHTNTKGFETNIKLTYEHFKLFTGYTFTDAKIHSGDFQQDFLLTPKHRLGVVIMYEEHENLRIGFESYYTGKQKLRSDKSRNFWVLGLMIEKRFKSISLFVNFENFLDTRQSKYGLMVSGDHYNPQFAEIYAPTDGRIINAGVKLNL